MTLPDRRLAPISAALVALLVAAACTASTGGAPSAAVGSPTVTPTADVSAAPSADPIVSPDPAPTGSEATGPVIDRPWATAQLVDTATGEPFAIADHAGKVVIVETMAIWCSNCRAQQRDVQEALARIPADRVVYVVLDVDPNENAASLADYRVRNGFEGRYAIAGIEVARALAADFGDQVLNPPSTPVIFIGTAGQITLTDFGHKSPDEIVALAEEHGA
jgi:thiol-disulfide isomerase/thioredoxin